MAAECGSRVVIRLLCCVAAGWRQCEYDLAWRIYVFGIPLIVFCAVHYNVFRLLRSILLCYVLFGLVPMCFGICLVLSITIANRLPFGKYSFDEF
jgi:hypothetical protein